MQNDPKWEQQQWTFPYEADPRLQREKDHWYITLFFGSVRIPIRAEDGEKLVAGLIEHDKAEHQREQLTHAETLRAIREETDEEEPTLAEIIQGDGPTAQDVINQMYRI